MQTEAKVGFAVMIAAVLLIALIGRVERWATSDQKGTRLKVRFDNVAGLETKSQVLVAGVRVGEVEAISLENDKADVTVRLFPGVQIHQGAKATIRSTGLLGEKFLELLPGDVQEAVLGEGAYVPQAENGGDLNVLLGELSAIATDIRSVTRSFKEAVGDEEGRRQLQEILVNIHDFTAALKKEGPSILARLNEIFDRIESGTGTLGKLVNQPEMYDDLQASVAELREVMAKVNRGEGTLGKLVQNPGLYDELEQAASGVREITEKATKGEGSIARLLNKGDTLDAIESAAEGIGGMGARAARMKLYVTFHNEFGFDRSESKGYFELRLRPRENYGYLVGVTDDPLGRTKLVTTTITPPGTTTEELRTDHRLKVSAMFERAFGDFSIHGGLMESSAGAGFAYRLFRWMSLGLDAWDFNSNQVEHDDPHLKVAGRIHLGRYIFVQGGMDNFLNPRYDTPFMGAGLTFEDDDLKYLLGTAASALR